MFTLEKMTKDVRVMGHTDELINKETFAYLNCVLKNFLSIFLYDIVPTNRNFLLILCKS